MIIFISYIIFHYYNSKIISLSFCILIIIKSYCENFVILLVKYINTIYFTNIYLLISIIELFSFLFQIVLNFSSDFHNILISYFIICFLLNILIYFIVFKFSAIHAIVCYKNSYILVDFISFDYISKKMLFLIMLLETFSSFIYLEIIELNFFKLNKNIKNHIISRGIIDTSKMINELQNENNYINGNENDS